MSTNISHPSRDLIATVSRSQPKRALGPLWRRLLAFVADSSFLYVVGRAVGFALYDRLAKIGPWGQLVGFSIALLYFAFLDSGIGKGQTLGKRLLRLKVVDVCGDNISFGKSILRFSVFASPYFLNGLGLPETRMPWIFPISIALIVYSLGGMTLYLLIFNRRTRQGVHDLVVGSYVIRAEQAGPVNAEPIWDAHWRVLKLYLSILILISVSVGFLANKVEDSEYVGPRLKDARLIEKLDGVQAARVRDWKPLEGLNWISVLRKDPLPKKTALAVTVWWEGKLGDAGDFADEVARIVLQNDPSVQEKELLSIHITCGYHLGIASDLNGQSFTHSPAEWHQRLFSPLHEPAMLPTK